ncbi:MAG: hypothetical protein HGB03_01465 [Candidatus Yonathbacteria bacterium]|nr:hypothetical protein [Candidatus Yonathbacteria bacterium]
MYQVPKQLRMGTERHNLNLPILRIGPQITIGYVLCNPTVFYLHLEDIQKIGEKGIFSEEALLGHILDLVNREILHDFKNADSIDDAPEKVFSVGQRKEVSLDGKMFPLTVINEEDRSKNGKVHICIVSIEMT